MTISKLLLQPLTRGKEYSPRADFTTQVHLLQPISGMRACPRPTSQLRHSYSLISCTGGGQPGQTSSEVTECNQSLEGRCWACVDFTTEFHSLQ